MSKPNILLIMSDQHLAEAMSCEGHAVVRTPHLDALAASGIRFRRAYSQDAICGPSRCSLITGLYPRTLGILTNGDGPPGDPASVYPSEMGRGGEAMKHAAPVPPVVRQTPLPNYLRQHGYHTACFGKQHLHRDLGVEWDAALNVLPGEAPTGYLDWIQARGSLHLFLRDWVAECGRHLPGLGTAFNASSSLAAQVSDLAPEETMEAYVRDRTVDFLRGAKSLHQPFFCKASFYRPHQPFTTLRKYAEQIDLATLPFPESFHEPAENLPPGLAAARADRVRPLDVAEAHEKPELFREFLRNYYGLIHELDDCIGDVLRVLEEEGLAEDTLVFYVSDHGEFAGNHGLFEKFAFDHNIYESTVRVPFLLSWKNHIVPGQVSEDLIELVDIYPTILAAAGLPAPETTPLAGIPMIHADGTRNQQRREFSVTENWVQSTVITDRWKYGRWNQPPATQGPRQMPLRSFASFGDMVFDRENDFHETRNLGGTDSGRDVANQLRKLLEEWEANTPGEARKWNSMGV